MALTLTVEPDVKDVRIDLDVAAAGTLTLTRTGPSGTPAAVRGYAATAVTAGHLIIRDFEAPIGVPLTYTASTGGTASITIPSGGCSDTWLTDLVRAGNTQKVVLENLAQLEYDVPSTTHWIIGRRAPIISGDVAHTPAFELNFLTATDEDREQARACLGNGVPVLLRTPPEDGIGNLYFAVDQFVEQRIVQQATQPARRFVVTATQVERPDPALWAPLGPSTYAHVKATFATYALLKAGRTNYDAVLYDWTGSGPSDIVPWPPDDV